MATKIHPTAVLAPGAELGVDVEVGPYCVVGPRVRVGDGTRLGPHVVIDGVTTLGQGNVVCGQSNLGGPPQDLSYKGEATELAIGDRNTIREFVTVNRGTVKGGGRTRIGSDCLLMACCHVAHDCEIRDRVILGNNVLLAGHVAVGERANVSGAAAAHHFVTIGAFAYVGGLTRIVQDVPPFMILEGHPSRVRAVNVIGLERAGKPEPEIAALEAAFRAVFRSGEPRRAVLDRLTTEAAETAGAALVREFVEHLEKSALGPKGRYRETLRGEFEREGRRRILGQVGDGVTTGGGPRSA
jgi:UDP-N-acetylglucosamine acyltransferase